KLGCAPTPTPCSAARITVSRIVAPLPACAPQATLAEVIPRIKAASSPHSSPTSALRSTDLMSDTLVILATFLGPPVVGDPALFKGNCPARPLPYSWAVGLWFTAGRRKCWGEPGRLPGRGRLR